MDFAFQRCLEENRLLIVQDSEESAIKELEAAKSDFHSGRMGLRVGDYKWSIIQAHVALCHAARSLLYSEGYEGKHLSSVVLALDNLFCRTGKLSRSSMEWLAKGQELRAKAELDLEYSKETAMKILAAAERFIHEAEVILIG